MPFPVFVVREGLINSKGKRGHSRNSPKAASTRANAAPSLEQRLLLRRSKVEIHRLYFGHRQFWWVLQAHKGKGGRGWCWWGGSDNCRAAAERKKKKKKQQKAARTRQRHFVLTAVKVQFSLIPRQSSNTLAPVSRSSCWVALGVCPPWHGNNLPSSSLYCFGFFLKARLPPTWGRTSTSGRVQRKREEAVRRGDSVTVLLSRAARSGTEGTAGGRRPHRRQRRCFWRMTGGRRRGREGGVFWWNLSDGIAERETSSPSSSPTAHATVAMQRPSSPRLPSSSHLHTSSLANGNK